MEDELSTGLEETTTGKDREITELKLRLAGETDRGHSPTPSLSSSIAELPIAT